VEAHYPEGGLGEAVLSELDSLCKFKILAVRKTPLSGKPDELINYEEISSRSIIDTIKKALH